MASIADLMFIPILALLIFGLAIFGVTMVPQASTDFKQVTNKGISDIMVQSMVSTMFNERNTEDIRNYRAISYRLCDSPSSLNNLVTSIEGTQPYGVSEVIGYFKLSFHNIPSQCSSVSSFKEERLFGLKSVGKRTYYYEKKIPVIGGEVVDMRASYEVE